MDGRDAPAICSIWALFPPDCPLEWRTLLLSPTGHLAHILLLQKRVLRPKIRSWPGPSWGWTGLSTQCPLSPPQGCSLLIGLQRAHGLLQSWQLGFDLALLPAGSWLETHCTSSQGDISSIYKARIITDCPGLLWRWHETSQAGSGLSEMPDAICLCPSL